MAVTSSVTFHWTWTRRATGRSVQGRVSSLLFGRDNSICNGPGVSLSVNMHTSRLTICQCHTSYYDHPTSNSCPTPHGFNTIIHHPVHQQVIQAPVCQHIFRQIAVS